MPSSRRFKFRIYQNEVGKYRIKNELTGGTLGPQYDTIDEAKQAIKDKVTSVKAAQRAGTKPPNAKS